MTNRRSESLYRDVVIRSCELALAEGRTFQLSTRAVRIILKAFAGVAAEALKRGDEVRIPGLGVLYMKDRAPRVGFNVRRKTPVVIPARRRVCFRKSDLLARQVEKDIPHGE